MPKKNRRSFLISQLVELSKDGWRHAKPYDYEPLERELREIDAKRDRPENVLNRIERIRW